MSTIIYLCLLLTIFLSGCKQPEPETGNSVDAYKQIPDIAADWNIDLSTLAQSPACDKGVLEFVMIVPQKTDIAYDRPRFFLYKNTQQNEYWVNLCGTIDGSCIGWFGPVTDEYIRTLFETLEQIDNTEWKVGELPQN